MGYATGKVIFGHLVPLSGWPISIRCARAVLGLRCVCVFFDEADKRLMLFLLFLRLSSPSPTRNRNQTTFVHSLHALPPHQPVLLSRVSIPSGLHYPPQRDISAASPSSSLAFHPHEMLLGVSGVDGTIRLIGSKLVDQPDASLRRNSLYTNHTQNGGPGYLSSIRSATP